MANLYILPWSAEDVTHAMLKGPWRKCTHSSKTLNQGHSCYLTPGSKPQCFLKNKNFKRQEFPKTLSFSFRAGFQSLSRNVFFLYPVLEKEKKAGQYRAIEQKSEHLGSNIRWTVVNCSTLKNPFSFSLPPPPQFFKVRRSTEVRGINLKGSSSDDRCRKQCCSY